MVQCESARRRDAQLRGRAMSAMATLTLAAAVAVVVMSVGDVGSPVSRGERVLLLQKAATEKLEEDDKCDEACKEKASMVKEQMQSLRKEIDSDYHSMTHFGDKAGYVPPPRSIRAQVMDGTLLKGNDGPAAPPPFSPNLSERASKGKAFGAANMKKLLKSQEPHAAHSSTAGSSILPPIISVGDMEKKMLRETPATPSHGSGDTMSFLHPDRDSAVHVHSSHHHSHSAGKAKWAKEFNFVKHHSKARRHSSGEATWAKDFSFVKHHEAKTASPTHVHSRAVRNRGDAEPAVVKRAMQKALSFAPHESKTEEAGDKLLGLHQHHSSSTSKHKSLLGGKFLAGWFGA